MNVRVYRIACSLPVVLAALTYAAAAEGPIMLYDFSTSMYGWTGNPRVTNMTVTGDGLYFESIGHDPWIESPPVEHMPLGARVRLTLRMRSDGDSGGEVFYGRTFAAERQAPFSITPDGEWHEYSVLLPEQRSGTRLRIDPAADTGTFTLAWIKVEALRPLATPPFDEPKPIVFDETIQVTAAPLTLVHDRRNWDGYVLRVDDAVMAMGHTDSAIGYLDGGAPAFFHLRDAEVSTSMDECSIVHHRSSSCTDAGNSDVRKEDRALVVEASFTDSGGANWKLSRRVEACSGSGALLMHTAICVDRDRQVFHLPWLTLFPGLDTFGTHKTQAILPGVEYLEDEPSSSEADFNAAQAERRIVKDHKLTLPMMALQHEGRYIGIIWDRSDQPAAVFDSPDRTFNSGAHLMGLWHPGVGDLRLENEFAALDAFTLKKGEPLELSLLFIGGSGESIVPAVQHYVALRGLPELPEFTGGLEHAARLLAAGWLDSEAHHDGLWRHAVWGDAFPPQPAADAPAFMLWLARHTEDSALAERLRKAARRGLERLTPPDNYLASVGHVSRPTPTLLFGAMDRNMARKVEGARAALDQFDDEGLRRYHQPDPNRPDYSRTHFADHANGYNAQVLETILEAAAFSGDQALAESGLALLDKQTRHYANTVPRGAQTWEMPLHTPDILGSARLIRTYVLGYLLSEQKEYLEQARYWAWTGIPFLYLDHPVGGPVGTYATIAVLGATNWVAPNWIGLPVQWCGLVYRSALHDLAGIDLEQGDFWDEVARGITISGLQQTFPLEDKERQGLLPDFFHLHEQVSDGPAIIPGTVQTHVNEVLDTTAYYSVVRTGINRALVHAPGGIHDIVVRNGRFTANISVWTDMPYWIRITGVSSGVGAVWNGAEPLASVYDAQFGALNIQVEGDGRLEITGI